jgi:hypothetical protein
VAKRLLALGYQGWERIFDGDSEEMCGIKIVVES